MGKLKYAELVFIENALTYFCINESKLMEEHNDMYSYEEIIEFRSSVQDLINKIVRIREGE